MRGVCGAPQLQLVHPQRMRRLKAGGTLASRQAIVHALVHIEGWAVDLSWDIIARFGGEPALPRGFYDDFVAVAEEECKHHLLLKARAPPQGLEVVVGLRVWRPAAPLGAQRGGARRAACCRRLGAGRHERGPGGPPPRAAPGPRVCSRPTRCMHATLGVHKCCTCLSRTGIALSLHNTKPAAPALKTSPAGAAGGDGVALRRAPGARRAVAQRGGHRALAARAPGRGALRA